LFEIKSDDSGAYDFLSCFVKHTMAFAPPTFTVDQRGYRASFAEYLDQSVSRSQAQPEILRKPGGFKDGGTVRATPQKISNRVGTPAGFYPTPFIDFVSKRIVHFSSGREKHDRWRFSH